MHCNAKHGRTGNKQENNVMKTGLSFRIFPLTGKNSNAYRMTLLSSQDFPACSLFYPVGHCSVTDLEIRTPSNVFHLMKT